MGLICSQFCVDEPSSTSASKNDGFNGVGPQSSATQASAPVVKDKRGRTKEPTKKLKGKVKRVVDGDTLIFIAEGTTEEMRIRFLGVDAPEKKQESGPESMTFVQELVASCHSNVEIHVYTTDRYGRSVADIIMLPSNKLLQLECLRAGHVWHSPQYDSRLELIAAMNDAKAHKRGLWKNPNAQAPWEFRQKK